MMNRFHFTQANELMKFIEKHEAVITAQHIQEVYNFYISQLSSNRNTTDEPLALMLDDYYVIIEYYFYSDLYIEVYDKDELDCDAHWGRGMELLRCIINKDIDGADIGALTNKAIRGVSLSLFSKSFEVNASTGEERPDGGDYFSTIRIVTNSGVLCICAEDALSDGYMDVWVE